MSKPPVGVVIVNHNLKDSLRETLERCDREGLKVLIEGGKTLAGMGPALPRADVSLSTTGLDKMLAHESADLTCSAQSGMRVAHLNAALAKHGQFVPIDVPLKPGIAFLGAVDATQTPARYAQDLKDQIVQRATATLTTFRSADQLTLPLRWREPRRIFVNSMSDLFHEAVPDEFIRCAFEVMLEARRHARQKWSMACGTRNQQPDISAFSCRPSTPPPRGRTRASCSGRRSRRQAPSPG